MSVSILIIAFAFLGMGLVGLVKPALIMKLVDSSAETVNSRNEVRAVYGGFGVCLAILLFASPTLLPELALGIYFAVGVALAGMALGRFISALIERPSILMWGFLFIEALAALILFNAAYPPA